MPTSKAHLASCSCFFWGVVSSITSGRRARSSVEQMLKLKSFGATVRSPEGLLRLVPTESVRPGDIVFVLQGERVPVDGDVISGRSALDVSHVTGEATRRAVEPGAAIIAGSLNCGEALTVRATTSFERSNLADIARLVDMAECRRGRYRSMSDRVAGWWTLVIHGFSGFAFLGWVTAGGAQPLEALVIAISVLIIACPCAVGLAVPAVETVATGALMRRGILVRAGDALERLDAVDTVVFDKTGTLTEPVQQGGDVLRGDARSTVGALQWLGLHVHLLSGDIEENVSRAARAAGIHEWTARRYAASQGREARATSGLGPAGSHGG